MGKNFNIGMGKKVRLKPLDHCTGFLAVLVMRVLGVPCSKITHFFGVFGNLQVQTHLPQKRPQKQNRNVKHVRKQFGNSFSLERETVFPLETVLNVFVSLCAAFSLRGAKPFRFAKQSLFALRSKAFSLRGAKPFRFAKQSLLWTVLCEAKRFRFAKQSLFDLRSKAFSLCEAKRFRFAKIYPCAHLSSVGMADFLRPLPKTSPG